ncbi:MAG: hypothetical protein AAFX56_11290 [Pseudomonadota bacterium]
MVLQRTLSAALFTALIFAAPAAWAQDYLTGMFRLTRQPADIVEPDVAQALDKIVEKNEKLQWQLYVPESYTPERPAGLFVYIDPNGQGRIPDGWQPVFDRHNVIWIGTRQTQRNANSTRKIWHAILGSRALDKDYAIDLQRMYVGGTRETVPLAVSTMLTANEFVGGIYTRGSFFSPELTADLVESLQRKGHVFITGTNDKAKRQVQSDYETYQQQGISDVKLIFDTQRLGDVGSPEQMDEAFRFLDARQ